MTERKKQETDQYTHSTTTLELKMVFGDRETPSSSFHIDSEMPSRVILKALCLSRNKTIGYICTKKLL